MKTSKGSHTVEVLDGDGEGIKNRGQRIEDLGEQMIGAAGILREIGEGATVQQGKSIEKIKNEVGDVHEELKKAGDRYKPTGTAMKRYGASLAAVQDEMRKIVAAAADAKRELDAANSTASTANAESNGNPDPDPNDPAAVQQAKELGDAADTANTSLRNADTALEDQFTLFDTQWDIWDTAYDDALDSINDATHGNISDKWHDNLAGVVDVVLTVLTYVGLALTVLALIVGGPILAAIAAVLALVVLAGTIFLYFKGRKSGADVAWAIAGVLPFGKVAKALKGASKFGKVGALLKVPLKEVSTPIGRLRALRGLKNGAFATGRSGLSKKAASGYANAVGSRFKNTGGMGPKGVWTRIKGGSNRTYNEAFSDAYNSFSPYQRNFVNKQIGTGPLRSVLDDGAKALTRADIATNVGEFVIKKGHTVDKQVTKVVDSFQRDPLDAWRKEYA